MRFDSSAAEAWVHGHSWPLVRPLRTSGHGQLGQLPRPLLLGLCADRSSSSCRDLHDLLGEAATRSARGNDESPPLAFALGSAAEHTKLAQAMGLTVSKNKATSSGETAVGVLLPSTEAGGGGGADTSVNMRALGVDDEVTARAHSAG